MRSYLETYDTNYFGHYLDGAVEWARSRGKGERSPLWADAKMVAAMRPCTVFDLGCGRGELLAMVASIIRSAGSDIRCYGYDPVSASTAYRQLTFAEFEVETECRSTDSTASLPDHFGDVYGFDVVVMRNVFECLDPEATPRDFDAEVRRTCWLGRNNMRKGGRLLFKTQWSAAPYDAREWEKARQAWRAAGAARHLVPWQWIDLEGRLYMTTQDLPETYFSLSDLYARMTRVNPWPLGPEELAAKYFPGMRFEYDAKTGWLALGEKEKA